MQLGADSTDLLLLVMNQRGLERLLSDKFALGIDVNVASVALNGTGGIAIPDPARFPATELSREIYKK